MLNILRLGKQLFSELNKKDKFFLSFSFLILITTFILGAQKIGLKSDFQDYYKASELFRNSKDIYQLELLKSLKESIKPEDAFKTENLIKLESLKNSVGTYIYPPTFAFLLLSISWLPYTFSSAIFYILNFSFLLISMYWILQITNTKKKYLILFLSIILSFRYLENHFYNNQVAFILLGLILYSIRTKNPYSSGAALSLAIVIKLTPGIFLLYFLFQKDWKKISLTIFFLVLWVLLPFLSGLQYNWSLLTDWIDMVLKNFLQNPEFRAWKNNQSLIATLAKYFLPNGDLQNQTEFGMPFITLSPKFVKIIFYFFALLFFGSGLLKYYKSKVNLSNSQVISLLFILSVIFSGISWIHSFVFLLFPITYGLVNILENTVSLFSKILFWISVTLPILSGRVFVGNFLEDLLLMISVLLYTSTLLYISILSFKKNGN
ncbi:MAG: DUF2029 domain-containing protein [Leptospiraceae bacterium]|nr:DUF2029 domain-containing protein [Leptospiraceae bacterium]MCK6382173.1 DUF2029 domain-containing protein [Leptospiraceae bacterium]NUM40994.1 DUF2029 domain-containing protein [Leptospiraceae bacterium]